MSLPFKLVSADSHIVEPPDLWVDRIDRKFRDRAPRIRDDRFTCEGSPGLGPDGALGLIATKAKYENPDHTFGWEGRWADVPEPAYDPDARVKEMDREGIEAELLYASFGLSMYGIPDKEFQFACMRAFNDWLADFCSASPKRLFGIAMIPTDIGRCRCEGNRAMREAGHARRDDLDRAGRRPGLCAGYLPPAVVGG